MACNSLFLVSGLTINDCCSGSTNSTLFTSGNSITLGEYLYTDGLCSVPAPNGYYAVEEYRATWGQIDSGIGNPGEIVATGTCFDCSLTGVCTIVPQFTTFSDCCNENYVFNVYHDIGTFSLGEVYLLDTTIFSGCATVVTQDTKYPFYCMNTATLEVDCTTCNSNNSIVCTIYTCDNGCYDLFTNSLTPYDGRYCKPGYDTYNNYNYYIDIDTETYVIYYDSTKWCLSTSLGGACLLFGNETCNDVCPDLCTELNISEYTTTTTSPCDIVDFEALFDCEMTPTPTPTPSITPTNTLTPTPTPTPTSTDLCSYTSISLSATTLPGSSPTPTPTPSQTPQIRDNCFSGDATFNIFTAEFDCPPD